MKLPIPPKEAMIYEDERVYVCLASYPLTRGHVIVAWKKLAEDIHVLSCEEYDYLMNVVDVTRDAMLAALKVEKVYLLYMDEIKEVHWHLVPRYNEEGINVLAHEPVKTEDFSLAPAIADSFAAALREHVEFVSLEEGLNPNTHF